MIRPGQHSADTQHIVFRDVLLTLICVIVAVMVVLLSAFNVKKSQEGSVAEMNGNLRVEAIWPNGIDADIDLWVEAPGEVPVGYSNMSGVTFNLVRDDLGTLSDKTPMNYEIAFARGLPEGEWTVNLHWFSNRAAVKSISVDVLVTIRRPAKIIQPDVVIRRTVTLEHVGEEQTVARFTLNADGKVVEGSISHLQRNLRSIWQGSQQ